MAANQKTSFNNNNGRKKIDPLNIRVNITKTQKTETHLRVWLEVVVARDHKTVPYASVLLVKDDGTIHSELKTLASGRVTFLYETLRAENPKTEFLRIHIKDELAESSVTVGVPPLSKEKENEDPERIEVNGWFVSDSGLLIVDFRVVAEKGKALKNRVVKLIFPHYSSRKYQYTVETDETGHILWACPILINPGTDTILLVSVDGIDSACELKITNYAPYEPPTALEKLTMLIRRVSFWIFFVPGLLSLPLFLTTFVRLLGTGARERVQSGHTSHDIWFIFFSFLFFLLDIILVFNVIYFFVKLKGNQIVKTYKYKKSRRMKASSKDSLFENLFEKAEEWINKKKDKGGDVNITVNNAGTASAESTSSVKSEAGFNAKNFRRMDFWNEMFVEGIYKLLGWGISKLKQ